MPNLDTITTCFDDVVSRQPDSCALIWKEGAWTYAELNARANRLAHFLLASGLQPEAPMGVYALRSPETLIAFLAILKAGGAYVPLDPAYPADRNRFCLEDAGVQLVLVDPKEQESLPNTSAKVVLLTESLASDQPFTEPPVRPDPHSLAYILYTSGSTGQPKGVLIEHQGVVRVTRDIEYARINPEDVLLQYAPLHFDASTFEIWAAWLNGACLALPAAGLNSLHDLGAALRSFHVSILWLTAGLFNLMVEQEINSLAGVRQLLTGGDVVSPVHAERFLHKYPGACLINGYGPTENTVFTACHRILLESPMPSRLSIGRPIRDTDVMIMDEKLQPLPVGEWGELIMTGKGLARGYLNQPELTAKTFIDVTDPTGKNVRAYRSGDLGRYTSEGTLEFQGRLDHQVKINGLRIELGEIQHVLQTHPEISGAEVLMVDASGPRRLEAFVVLRAGSHLSERSLRDYLGHQIPIGWLPAVIRIIPALPLNANGKVDRHALLEMAIASPGSDELNPGDEPGDFLEKAVWNIWQEILPATAIGLDDNFFDLGGDSLSAMNMIAQVEKTTERQIGLRPLLEKGTIRSIVSAARETGPVASPPLLTCTQPGAAKAPFFFAHGDYTAGGLFCQKVAQAIGADQPFYALTPPGTYGEKLPTNIEEIAGIYLASIRSIQPRGPYYLGGFCNGALAMYEVIQRLIQEGETVATFVLLYPPDLYLPKLSSLVRGMGKALGLSEQRSIALFGRIAEYLNVWLDYGFWNMLTYGWDRVFQRFKKERRTTESPINGSPATNVNLHYIGVVAGYGPLPLKAVMPVLILLGQGKNYPFQQQVRFWSRLIPHARFEVVGGTHDDWRKSLGDIGGKIGAAIRQSGND